MNKIKTTEPKAIWKIRCTLGEGTLWVKEHNSIYFVDIKKKKICSLNIFFLLFLILKEHIFFFLISTK